MQYMFLLYYDETQAPAPGTPEFDAQMQAYGGFTEEMKSSGDFSSGDPLQPVATATVVRAPGGGTPVTTDGPFAESKEQLGGYYVLECRDLDEAVERAAKIPASWNGAVEVRPILQFG